MSRHMANLNYPRDYKLILKSSWKEDEFFGVDKIEYLKFRLIQKKYDCRHCFHTLPDEVTLNLHRFEWDELSQKFNVQLDKIEKVQLNTLEEAIVEYTAF